MTKNPEIYYAKVLLFGEYSIMCDSMGLTIPYTHYKGELSFINEDKYTDYEFAINSNRLLGEYHDFLEQMQEKQELPCKISLEQFQKDIDNGLYFESTIPQGYGLGSSGAVVAAVYQHYGIDIISNEDNITSENLLILKRVFSKLEQFFHGVSSGMDPLNCYIKSPLLIKSKTEIMPVGIPREFSKNGGIFLINTGNSGKTEPLVNLFFDQCKQDDFMHFVQNQMIPTTDSCIKSLISGEIKPFFSSLKVLSQYTIDRLNPMIPVAYQPFWKFGINSDLFYLKLCGSGGGGFLLGFSENLTETREYFRMNGIEITPISKHIG